MAELPGTHDGQHLEPWPCFFTESEWSDAKTEWKDSDCIATRIGYTLRSTATHHQKPLASPPAAALTSTSYRENLIFILEQT